MDVVGILGRRGWMVEMGEQRLEWVNGWVGEMGGAVGSVEV